MARVTIEDCLEDVTSRFALVQVAVSRVLQLRRGASPFVDAPKNKEVVRALREIAARKVTPENIRQFDAIEAREIPRSLQPEESAAIHREVEELIETEAKIGYDGEFGEVSEGELGGGAVEPVVEE